MITLNELAVQIAEISGCTPADAETFLRELVAVVSEQLEEQGEAEVPSLGRFAIIEGELKFSPNEELAVTINAPFADFSPVTLPDGYMEEEPQPQVEQAFQPATPEEEDFDVEEAIPTPPAYEPIAEKEEVQPEPEPEPEVMAEPAVCREEVAKAQSRTWPWWMVACVATFFLGYWLGGMNLHVPDLTEDNVEPMGELTDSLRKPEPTVEIEEIPEVKEYPQVLDTITATKYLTTMARNHYGQMDYWVYIYEANADKLGHPDRLEGGVVVRIPPADSLGLVAGDKEKIAEAQALAVKIYSNYGR